MSHEHITSTKSLSKSSKSSSSTPSTSSLSVSIPLILSSASPSSLSNPIVALLLTIIDNIVQQPEENKFRTIKKEKILSKLQGASRILLLIGFQETPTSFVFPSTSSLHVLQQCHAIIHDYISERERRVAAAAAAAPTAAVRRDEATRQQAAEMRQQINSLQQQIDIVHTLFPSSHVSPPLSDAITSFFTRPGLYAHSTLIPWWLSRIQHAIQRHDDKLNETKDDRQKDDQHNDSPSTTIATTTTTSSSASDDSAASYALFLVADKLALLQYVGIVPLLINLKFQWQAGNLFLTHDDFALNKPHFQHMHDVIIEQVSLAQQQRVQRRQHGLANMEHKSKTNNMPTTNAAAATASQHSHAQTDDEIAAELSQLTQQHQQLQSTLSSLPSHGAAYRVELSITNYDAFEIGQRFYSNTCIVANDAAKFRVFAIKYSIGCALFLELITPPNITSVKQQQQHARQHRLRVLMSAHALHHQSLTICTRQQTYKCDAVMTILQHEIGWHEFITNQDMALHGVVDTAGKNNKLTFRVDFCVEKMLVDDNINQQHIDQHDETTTYTNHTSDTNTTTHVDNQTEDTPVKELEASSLS